MDNYSPGTSGFRILFLDEQLLIIDKPPGLFVHRNSFEPEAANCVDMLEKQFECRPFTVHRLDRGTSGILVFARDPVTAGHIAEQFRNGSVKKRYLALVRGHLLEKIEVDRPVKDAASGVRHAARSIIHPHSHTVFPEPSSKYDESWYSLVEIELLTGRRHQARSHCAFLSHPIIGDTAHGDQVQNRFFRERFGFPFMFLRSVFISFEHPVKKAPISLSVEIPQDWKEVLLLLGFENGLSSDPAG